LFGEKNGGLQNIVENLTTERRLPRKAIKLNETDDFREQDDDSPIPNQTPAQRFLRILGTIESSVSYSHVEIITKRIYGMIKERKRQNGIIKRRKKSDR
jgi:hypothetical protein